MPKRSYRSTIRAGKTREVKFTVKIGCDIDPKTLMDKIELDMYSEREGGGMVNITYKEIQVFDSSRDIILFGIPNNSDPKALNDLLRTQMIEAKRSMFTNNPDKYPQMIYGRPLPDFDVIKDFVKNTPFEARDEDEDLPAWAKQALHLEVARVNQELMTEIVLFMMDSGKWKRLFGTFTWVAINPGFDASATDSNTLGTMV